MLNKDKSAIIRLLDAYTSTSWGVEDGISYKSDFEKNEYNSLTNIFNPDYIIDSIKSYLGKIPDDQENFPRDFEKNDRSIILEQFIWIHRRALIEQSKKIA